MQAYFCEKCRCDWIYKGQTEGYVSDSGEQLGLERLCNYCNSKSIYGWKQYCPQCKEIRNTTCSTCGCGRCLTCDYRFSCMPAQMSDLHNGVSWVEPPNVTKAKRILQKWVDRQGHERCWYYPEIFRELCNLFDIKISVDPNLPPEEEFKEGCNRYRKEEYASQKISGKCNNSNP